VLSAIEARNFQSWEHLKFDVTKGITLIDGFNHDDGTSEGSGKSAVVNALCWGLYGKLPKDSNIDDVLRDGQTSMGVAIKFANGDQVVRVRTPNDLFIQTANGKIIKGKDAKETQNLIEDYIGYNFDTFCQCTYYPQNYPKKFLSSNQEDKGKILSGIQNLSLFDKARKEVMDLLKIENEKIITMTQKLELEGQSINHLNSKIQMLDTFMGTKQKQYEQSRFEYEQHVARSKSELDQQERYKADLQNKWTTLSNELNGQLDNGSELSTELEGLRSAVGTILTEKSQLTTHNRMVNQMNQAGVKAADKYNKLALKKSEIDNFIKNPSTKCPSCGSELKNIDLSHALNELNSVNLEMVELLVNLNDIGEYLDKNSLKDLQSLEAIESSQRIRISEIEAIQSKVKAREKEIDTLKYNLMSVDANISSAKTKVSQRETDLNNLQPPNNTEELAEKQTLIKQLYEQVEKYGHVETLVKKSREYAFRLEQLKEGFREIKSYVFNKALNELNYRINKYLNELFQVEASIKFITEDQKIETRITISGRERGPGLLSGGQHRRFNLAVDLALSDLTAGRKASKLNILILDEYFKDLSEVSMNKCLDILKARKSPVLIIEHNTIFKTIVDNTFFVDLDNGVSREFRQ